MSVYPDAPGRLVNVHVDYQAQRDTVWTTGYLPGPVFIAYIQLSGSGSGMAVVPIITRAPVRVVSAVGQRLSLLGEPVIPVYQIPTPTPGNTPEVLTSHFGWLPTVHVGRFFDYAQFCLGLQISNYLQSIGGRVRCLFTLRYQTPGREVKFPVQEFTSVPVVKKDSPEGKRNTKDDAFWTMLMSQYSAPRLQLRWGIF